MYMYIYISYVVRSVHAYVCHIRTLHTCFNNTGTPRCFYNSVPGFKVVLLLVVNVNISPNTSRRAGSTCGRDSWAKLWRVTKPRESDRALYLDYQCIVFLQALGSLHCALCIYALQTWNTYVTTMLPSAKLTMHQGLTHTHPTMQCICLV